MKKRHKKLGFLALVFVLLLLLLTAYIYIKKPTLTETIPGVAGNQPVPTPSATSPTVTTTPATPVPSVTVTASDGTIKVAAFNLQVFGVTKAEKPEVMDVLSRIVRNYDVIAVQEIRDASQTALPSLVSTVNSLGSPQYNYVVSERLGRTTSKEQYAYLYNTQTVQVIGTPYTYPDTNDLFEREPYVANFKMENGNFDFVLIAIHADPDTAEQEISDLPMVVEEAKSRYQGEGDFVILGDLNADCDYFDENSQSPLRSGDYQWIIDNGIDTTTKATTCTYDRIVISNPARADFTGDSGIFRFDEAYSLNYDSTTAVSDHYPVFGTFWSNRDGD